MNAIDQHICFRCRKEKECPCSNFDGMIGPTISCQKFFPKGWTGIFYTSIFWYGLVISVSVISLIIGIYCT